MTTRELAALLDRLRAEPRESEWLEFKATRCEPKLLGEYLSALANSACLLGKPRAYMVFGVEDGSHAVVGTNFDPAAEKGHGSQPLPLWLSLGLHPNTGFDIHTFDYQDKRVVLFEIHPAFDRPVKFYGTACIRDGSSKTELARYPEKERQIWQRRVDWSALICERATLADLDPAAIVKARLEYQTKFPAKVAEVDAWDDATFLNKAKLTTQGAITHAALLLLGREETTTLLAPAVARISWIPPPAEAVGARRGALSEPRRFGGGRSSQRGKSQVRARQRLRRSVLPRSRRRTGSQAPTRVPRGHRPVVTGQAPGNLEPRTEIEPNTQSAAATDDRRTNSQRRQPPVSKVGIGER